MLKLKAIYKSLAIALCFSGICNVSANANVWGVDELNRWTLEEDNFYSNAKDSSSNYLKIKERIPHRELIYRVNNGMIDSYSFSLGCTQYSATPTLNLRVNALDIPMQSTLNGRVFARFLVDQNDEIALRGEIKSSGRLVFLPLTKEQEQKLSSLLLQLNEGGKLQIALLQGENSMPKIYDINLAGFSALSKNIIDDCKLLSQYNQKAPLLPDYVTAEPKNVAPADYSLKDQNTIDNPGMGLETQMSNNVNNEDTTKTEPIIHDFKPDGSISSIGPDGLPVGVNDNEEENTKSEESMGTATPMQIDEDGMPIF